MKDITAIKGILFDFDGTVGDTWDLIMCSMRYATRAVLGREIPDEVLSAGIGTPLDDQMVVLAGGDVALGKHMAAVYRDHNHAVHDAMIKPFPGVVDTLQQLQARGYAMGVVTSKLHKLAWHGCEVVGAAPYFDLLIAPDDFPLHKPDPGPVLEGCRRLGLAPQECAYVGDSPYDMQAGRGAGCFTVAATYGMFSREKVLAEGPDTQVAEFSQLLELFR